MTTQDAAQKIIDAVQARQLSRETCEERLETMERKAQAGETLAPFATAAELAACCALVRTGLQMPKRVIETQAEWAAYRATLITPEAMPVRTDFLQQALDATFAYGDPETVYTYRDRDGADYINATPGPQTVAVCTRIRRRVITTYPDGTVAEGWETLSESTELYRA